MITLTFMILCIINLILTMYLVFKTSNFYVEIKKDYTFYKTFLGYSFAIWKKTGEMSSTRVFYFLIPVRNRNKTEQREEVERMMQYSSEKKLQSLRAIFSWLKTWEEVRKFEEIYHVVDRKIVEQLVANFKPKE